MRFGKTLKNSIYPPWKDKYIDYAKVKSLLREKDIEGDDSDNEVQPWTEQDEEAFVQELINVQLDKVNAFQSETSQKLREQTAACESKLSSLVKKSTDQGEAVTDEAERRKVASDVLQELDNITNEVNELEKYSRINFTGFLKAAKKHDRKRGARYRIRALLQVRLSNRPFNTEDYSPLLNRLSAMYTFARETLNQKAEDAQRLVGEDRLAHDAYVSYKFWVHTDNVLEVKTHILRQLPVLLYNPTTSKELDVSQKDPTITSLYFDNPQFDLYNEKVARAPEAGSLRLRWSGDLKDKPSIFLEKKVVTDNDRSHEVRVQLKEKHVMEFLRGEYGLEKKINRLEGVAHGESEEAEGLKKDVEDLQSFIKTHGLQPMLRANYTRTAFQIPGDNRVRISLDTNLALIREDSLDPVRPCRDPENWHRKDIDDSAMQYPFSSINKGEIVRFPHALLEIKLRPSSRHIEWLNDLMVSHLVKEAPRFSKFAHGVAQLFEDNINTFPFWLSELDQDIRRNPETAFQEEQERLAKRAEEEMVVGSFLGSKASPLQTMVGSPISRMNAGRGMSPARSSVGTGGPPIPGPSSMPGAARVGQAQAERNRQISIAKPGAQPAEEEGATESSYLSNLFPSFSMSRYAQSRRRQSLHLPPGVEAPTVWIKDSGPVRVESKVWLANQRTFIKWQHVSVLLASLSLALYNAAGIDNTVAQALAIVYTCFALFASAWGWYMHERRGRLIRERSGKDLDNLVGPVVVCVGLAAALVMNFGFRYQAALREIGKDQNSGVPPVANVTVDSTTLGLVKQGTY
ncbi:Vacuolar transporter chaperone 2 [Talaromyces islandicus]|uniref:Vacuolar transporter chaperone 2 n=1 Tax=Talaromyces islandicus TaxID=28573 RepID=A0A0U1LM58_TALIS|nr:Vacuolar transporter chaperone 2 [Talaromyces islandicus]